MNLKNRSVKSLFVAALVAGMVATCLLTPASATLLFDNFKGTGATIYVEETRPANLTFGTVLNSTATTTINQMEFRWRPNNDMDVTFYIFDSQLNGSFGSVNWSPIGNNLLFSQTKHFTALGGPVDFDLVTDPFNFTFQANHRYDIGILGSTGSLTGSWDIENGIGQVNTIQGGFESINRNANLVPTRSDLVYAGVDPHVRLISTVPEPVPEPSTWMLMGTGIIGVLGYGWRKRQRQIA